MSEAANGPTLVQTDDPNDYYEGIAVVDRLNVVATLLAPYCLDAGNPGVMARCDDPGLKPYGLTPEGWRMLPAIVRAIDNVLEVQHSLDGVTLLVNEHMVPLRWAIHALDRVRREPTPDLRVPENAADILDEAFFQVRRVRNEVRLELNKHTPEGRLEPGLPD